MIEINLRDLYPESYKTDYYISVPEEVVAVLKEFDRKEKAYKQRMYYNRAHYSLDRGDGIENETLFFPPSPSEIYERKEAAEQLHAAISTLSGKQAKRIYAYYFLGMSKAEIARVEGVSNESVGESIQRGLQKIAICLSKNLI